MASQLWAAFLSLTLTVGGVVLLFSALEPSSPPPGEPPPPPLTYQQLLTPALDAEGCEAEDTALLVTSHAAHSATRAAHRRAYPASLLRSLGVRRVFLLAKDEAWAAVEAEGRRHGDVVAGAFTEAYRNLTLKHLMGLRWAASRCPRAAHVVKMDDDVVADLYRALPLIRDLGGGPLLLAGYPLRGAAPSRDPRSKWFVTREEFPGDSYPDFLSGWFYVTTPETARRLVGAALALPPTGGWFWIDDVFVTGVLARTVGVAVAGGGGEDLSAVFAAHSGFLECCVAAPGFSCEYLVGPDGGDPGLQERFQGHAERCWASREGGCPRREVAGACVRKVEAAQGPGEGRVGVARVNRLTIG